MWATARSTAASRTGHLPGTVEDTAAQVDAAGGRAVAVACDHTDDSAVRAVVRRIGVAHGGLDLLRLVTNDHDPGHGPEPVDRGEQVQQHRPPRNRVQHLVQIGFHPRSLAGGKDDGGDGPDHGRLNRTETLPFP